jgi:cell division protein FtsQ
MKVKRKQISKRRDPHAGREEARRFAANVSTGIVIVGAIIGVIVVANRWLAKEGVESVRIIGRVILDSAEIMQQAAVPDSVPLQKLNLQTIETRIKAHPFISRSSVYRGENGTLVVEISERTPQAVTFVNGAPVYLDSVGFNLPYRFSSAGFDIPVISGVLADEEHIDSVRACEALGVARTIREYSELLYRQISEVHREHDGEYTLISADGAIPIHSGAASTLPEQLPKLEAFLTRVVPTHGADRAAYIDLRWKGQVVVRWRERQQSPQQTPPREGA